jgi:4-amino-4-deoxy-L-arabinose transferase-like glycosyltransferase
MSHEASFQDRIDGAIAARIERWARGWRAPAFAALVALLAGLPGLFAVPPLDRDESRFAQATAQMLETGDLTSINFQAAPRSKKPVGIHWLQAASVSLLSSPENREIWAFRIPSLLGAMLAAAACAWGATAAFGARSGLIAGAVLGATALLSTEAFIAKTDAVLCGATTLAMAALARLYLTARGRQVAGSPAGRREKLLFWTGISLAMLVKGPVGPLTAVFAMLAISAWDRDFRWLKTLGWGWGLLLLAAVTLPWSAAITVATDGAFWSTAIGGDMAPKLVGGQETHGAPPGYHLLAAILLLFPATLLLPAAGVAAWKGRREAGVRFALCWLIPVWVMFEALPTKLVHYPLPAYGALAWLIAAALREPLGGRVRWIGAGLGLLAGALFAIIAIVGLSEYGDRADVTWASLAAGLFVISALAGGYLLLRRAAASALFVGGALGVLAHGALMGGLIPRLEPLWPGIRAARALAEAGLAPRDGAPGPVAVTGYAEPSLIFTLGTPTALVDPQGAAEAVIQGRPAIVEDKEDAAFRAALAEADLAPRPVAAVSGTNYSDGEAITLRVYRGEPQAPETVPAPPALIEGER